MSDRFFIQCDTDVVLSPQELVSCDPKDYGCSGGFLRYAIGYIEQYGVVADKDYPYTSGRTGRSGSCKSTAGMTKYFVKKGSSRGATTASAIKNEIEKNGPCETRFNVYNDFFNYKGGVYSHTSGGLAGGHAVKMIGWGTENGQDYWLCANSWGPSWGLQGFFKMAVSDADSDMSVCVSGDADCKSYSDFLY